MKKSTYLSFFLYFNRTLMEKKKLKMMKQQMHDLIQH